VSIALPKSIDLLIRFNLKRLLLQTLQQGKLKGLILKAILRKEHLPILIATTNLKQ